MQKILQYKKTLIFLALIAALVIAYKAIYPTATVRYKLTVEIDTPESVKTGSAVREVKIWRTPKFLPEVAAIGSKMRGEAVVVDLGKRGVVFGLLRGAGGEYDAHDNLAKALPPMSRNAREFVLYYKKLKIATRTLTPEAYPTFVYFRDAQDLKTVEVLSVADNSFAEVFGEGVALKSITIEMTHEPVTRMVGKYMPSYNRDYDGFMMWFNSLPYGDERKIGPDVFGSWGEK